LNDLRYQNLRKCIKTANIRGCEVGNINDVSLKLIGIRGAKDRKRILNFIFDLTSNSNAVAVSPINIDQEVPDSYCDPISYEIMTDPVLVTVSGHSYDRAVIEQYVRDNGIDPITLQKVEMSDIVANRALKESIDIWWKAQSAEGPS